MSVDESFGDETIEQSIFSREDYYPTPNESKLSYAQRGKSSLIMRTDLYALIVKLTSPIDAIEYMFLSDFFLSYRKFMKPIELLDLLKCRLQWTFNEIMCGNSSREKIGQVAAVRTFVVFRHWILNYFAQDFLTDAVLRKKFVSDINELQWDNSKPTPKLIQGIVITIKKSWVMCLKLMWEDVSPDITPSNPEEWLHFPIRDITPESLPSGEGGKRLSFYALQSSQNPEFRNRSVLSLYMSKENFQLPETSDESSPKTSVKVKQRTASMFLFPRDNSSPVVLQPKGGNSHEDNSSGFVIPKTGSVTEVIKDLHVPPTPSVDKLIPPTPAKNIEFILRSSYLPSRGARDNTERRKKESTGMLGLLSKWKRNHNTRVVPTQAKQQSTNFEIENFIKLVFSITSLENKDGDEMQKLLSTASSKFDILSARTIDEVEYFIAKENELLAKVSHQGRYFDLQKDTRPRSSAANPEATSAMDNLNLYKTVSFIASSVISLSKTLQSHQITSPSYAAFERRRVNSVDGSFKDNRAVTRAATLRSNTRSPILTNDGPRKLVFHGQDNVALKRTGEQQETSAAVLRSSAGVWSHSAPNLVSPLPKSMKETQEKKSSQSPTRNLLRLSSSIIEVDDMDSNSNRSNTLEAGLSESHSISSHSPVIKRKDGLQNLREFNFEEDLESENTNHTLHEIVTDDSPVNLLQKSAQASKVDEDNSSFITSNENISIRESAGHITPASSIAHRSVSSNTGRISLLGSRNPRTSLLKPVAQISSVVKDDAFKRLDNELLNNQEEIRHLEERTSFMNLNEARKHESKASQVSLTSSVPTDQLYASRNPSPRKEIGESNGKEDFTANQKLVRLSLVPSIRSIVSEDSFSTFHTVDTFSQLSTSSKVEHVSGTGASFIDYSLNGAVKESLTIADSDDKPGNKYLFSPDNGSIDDASPEKNVDDLKIKFISPAGNDSQSMNDGIISMIEGKEDGEPNEEQELDDIYREKHQNEHHRRTVTPIVSPYKAEDSRLNNLANLTDESLHGDPVNVALMKLEGTFASNQSKNENQETSAEELTQRRLSVLRANDRNSFLIERRRQVKSEIPMTPHSKSQNGNTNQKATESQIRELLSSYTLQDSRLDVTNAAQHVPFILMYDSKSIAEQLTLVEREILSEIDWKELLDLKVSRNFSSVTSWLQLLLQNVNLSGIDLAIARFNLTVDWVISEIVLTTDNKLRRNTIQRFIHVADHCRSYQNYNTLMEIVLGLSSLVVQSFRDAWRLIEPGDVLIWETLKNIPSLEKNYQNVRGLLNDIDPLKGCIPFIVVYLSDLTLNSEKNNWIVANEVLNYSKFQTNVQIVKNFIQRAQWSKFYDIQTNDELLSKCVYISCLSQAEITQLKDTLASPRLDATEIEG
ncbi:LAFA_0C09076g1_1 [Lachancea sp. 'fantastica']|nr:LAFA_0C09076g1_1 [Lachancea sp. 'fantastica']